MKINIKRMGHVAIEVENVEAAAKFYSNTFGFDIIYIFDDWGMVRKNKDDITFIKKGNTHHKPHFGLRVKSREEVDKASDNLAKNGITTLGKPELHKDESYSLYFEDPDGNIAEIIYDPNVE